MNYGASTGLAQTFQETILVDMTNVQGTVTPGKAGTEYYFPPTRFASRKVVSIVPITDERGGGKVVTAAALPFLFLTLYASDGSIILQDMPVNRLAGIVAGAAILCRVPLLFRPQVIDARRSFIFSTFAVSAPVPLVITYL